jgi:type I restriction enzyme S subunit
MRPLGDVAQFLRGITFKPEDVVKPGTADSVVCMRTKNVQVDLDQDDLIAVPSHFVRRDELYLRESDILVSTANSWNLVGKCSWVPRLDYDATAGGFISILRADVTKILPRYLYYWFNSDKVQHATRLCGRQTTNISNMSFERCEALEIPLPPLPEQKRIADILDKADAIRRKRREVSVNLCDYSLSLFQDMFGHPDSNPQHWPIAKFSEVCDSRLGKMLDAKRQTGGDNRPYMRNLNVQWGRLDLSSVFQMDFDDSDRQQFRLRYGDVLICEGGAGVGQTAIWRDELPECYFQKSLHRVRPYPDKATPEYISFLMWVLMKGSSLLRSISSATIPHLTGEKIKEIRIPLPPLAHQKQFSSQCHRVRVAHCTAVCAVNDADGLFNSLVTRAFEGDI